MYGIQVNITGTHPATVNIPIVEQGYLTYSLRMLSTHIKEMMSSPFLR